MNSVKVRLFHDFYTTSQKAAVLAESALSASTEEWRSLHPSTCFLWMSCRCLFACYDLGYREPIYSLWKPLHGLYWSLGEALLLCARTNSAPLVDQ